MVDFQSRDTRRGVDDDTAEQDEQDTEPEPSQADGSEPADADESTETGATAGEAVSETGFAVVSIGTGRTVDRDPPGEAVIAEIDAGGGHVATREVIDADFDGIQRDVTTLVDRRDVQAIVTTGSAGVEPDDVAIEAIEPMLDRTLPGFGEILRLLCYDDAGSAVIRTRATAGTIDDVPVFCLPGDPDLSSRGVRELVVPEAETIGDLAGPGTPE